jgi:hypothetical protein
VHRESNRSRRTLREAIGSGVKITYHKPAASGVNQLMYVGDDAAVESATGGLSMPVKVAIAAVAAWILFWRK